MKLMQWLCAVVVALGIGQAYAIEMPAGLLIQGYLRKNPPTVVNEPKNYSIFDYIKPGNKYIFGCFFFLPEFDFPSKIPINLKWTKFEKNDVTYIINNQRIVPKDNGDGTLTVELNDDFNYLYMSPVIKMQDPYHQANMAISIDTAKYGVLFYCYAMEQNDIKNKI